MIPSVKCGLLEHGRSIRCFFQAMNIHFVGCPTNVCRHRRDTVLDIPSSDVDWLFHKEEEHVLHNQEIYINYI